MIAHSLAVRVRSLRLKTGWPRPMACEYLQAVHIARAARVQSRALGWGCQ